MIVPICAALAAAAFNGLAGFLQHGASKQVAPRRALEPQLLFDLGRNRRWLVGAGCDVTAFGLQVLALATGPLLLVQPLLVMSILMAVALRALAAHHGSNAPAPLIWGAAVLCCLGLAAFLVAASPSPGPRSVSAPSGWDAVALGIGLGLVLFVCLGLASRRRGNRRAVPLAAAAGVLYGATAGMAKLVVTQVSIGWLTPLHHWHLYAAVVLGLTGAQLNQTAFQAGALAAPVAVITVTDPVTSIAIGLVWLGETVQTGPGPVIAATAGFVAMSIGIGRLARETPQVRKAPA